jgi:hypothetical protein
MADRLVNFRNPVRDGILALGELDRHRRSVEAKVFLEDF